MNTELLYKYIEYFGFISGILYLILEIKQSKLMWLIGILSAIAYIIVFAESLLFAAMGLQAYFLVISIYGWFQWKRGKEALDADIASKENPDKTIFYRNPSIKTIIISTGVFLAIFLLLLTILKNMTGDPMPTADAAATALSVVATYWLSRSYRVQWLLWVVVNIITLLVCFSQELYLTSVLYTIYTVSAVYGYFHWGSKGVLLENKK